MTERKSQVMTREFLAERDARMFKMRQAGVSVGDIARRFGISPKAVHTAMQRQLEKLNGEALMAYPDVLRMELERLDNLQAAIWPLTQHRKVKMDDGTEIQVEPDLKAIQQVLLIMDRRAKLLGMDQKNVNIQMDVNSNQNIKATLSGSIEAIAVDAFDPEKEAKQLLEIMGRSGVLPQDMINNLLGRPGEVIMVEPRGELELPMEADENE
jgi:DNA-binding CsgD family transcriptional regulator